MNSKFHILANQFRRFRCDFENLRGKINLIRCVEVMEFSIHRNAFWSKRVEIHGTLVTKEREREAERVAIVLERGRHGLSHCGIPRARKYSSLASWLPSLISSSLLSSLSVDCWLSFYVFRIEQVNATSLGHSGGLPDFLPLVWMWYSCCWCCCYRWPHSMTFRRSQRRCMRCSADFVRCSDWQRPSHCNWAVRCLDIVSFAINWRDSIWWHHRSMVAPTQPYHIPVVFRCSFDRPHLSHVSHRYRCSANEMKKFISK